MANKQSLLSPKKPDGTTDWDVVFDDPEQGLVALIDRVNSTDSLHKCGEIMIKRLFTRKNDQENVARFTSELNDIISKADTAGDFSEIKAEVAAMLRKIKAIRVAKAKAYLEEKSRSLKIERRSSSDDIPDKQRSKSDAKTIPLFVGGAALSVAALIGLIFWLAYTPTPQEIAAEKKALEEELAREIHEQEEEERLKKEAINREVDRKIAAIGKSLNRKEREARLMPPAIVLPGAFIQEKEGPKKRKGSNLVMPILILDDRKSMSDVCRIRPKLMDIVNVSMSKLSSSLPEGEEIDFAKLESIVKNQINKNFSQVRVIKVMLVTTAKTRDMAAAGERCQFASSRYFDYIFPPSK